MKRKYSKIYYRSKDKLFGFRYNYENNMLEWVSKWDMVWNKETKEYDDVTLPDWKVTDAVGLSLDNWKDDPDYWVDYYQEQISEECSYELQYI
jgi:hypothetical protein